MSYDVNCDDSIQCTQVARPEGDSPVFFTVDIENILDRFKNLFCCCCIFILSMKHNKIMNNAQ